MANGSRTNRRGSETRAALLAAGAEEFHRLTLAELLGALGPTRVTRAAGLASQSAFFHHFGDQASWAEELARHFLRRGGELDLIADTVTESVRDLAASFNLGERPDWTEGLRSLADLDWTLLRDDPAATARLLALWLAREQPLMSPAPGERCVGDLVAGTYDRYHGALQVVYEQLISAWGRKVRSEFTVAQIATVLSALVQGLAIRHAVDPAAVPDDLFGKVVTRLVPVMTTDKLDRSSAEEHLARLGTTSHTGDRVPNGALLDALERLLERRSWAFITVADISDEAGVPPSTAYDNFGSKVAIAVALWRRQEAQLGRYVEELVEREGGRDPLDLVRLGLDRFIALVRHDRDLSRDIVSAALGVIQGEPELGVPSQESCRSVLAPLVRVAQADGGLRADLDAETLGGDLHDIALVLADRHPDVPAHELAAQVFDLVVNGAAPRV